MYLYKTKSSLLIVVATHTKGALLLTQRLSGYFKNRISIQFTQLMRFFTLYTVNLVLSFTFHRLSFTANESI